MALLFTITAYLDKVKAKPLRIIVATLILAIAIAGLSWLKPFMPPFLVWGLFFVLALLFLCYAYIIQDLLSILQTMWLPVLLTLGVAFILFLSDQGKDLTAGLLSRLSWMSVVRNAALLVALLYWALSAWHASRLFLNRRFPLYPKLPPEQEKYRIWVRWPPRIVGLSAHLFAAINLTLAAWSRTQSSERLVLVLGPLAILAATVILYIQEHNYRKEREKKKKEAAAAGTPQDSGDSSLSLETLMKVIFLPAFVPLVLAYAAAWWFASRINEQTKLPVLPDGFALSSSIILTSATAFLAIVIFDRLSPNNGLNVRLRGSYALSGIAFLFVILFCLFPVSLSTFLGATAVTGLGVGSIIAIINLLFVPLDYLLKTAKMPDRGVVKTQTQDEEEKEKERQKQILAKCRKVNQALPAVYTLIFGVLAVGMSYTFEFNRVRLCNGEECKAEVKDAPGWKGLTDWKDRPNVETAAKAWYDQARAYFKQQGGKDRDPVPLLIVATAGGGIRASYWTDLILETLDDANTGIGSDGLRHYLFAISSVSGGSLGAVEYAASLQRSGVAIKPTDGLKNDLLAPALAAMMFHDILANVVPIGGADRGIALEMGWEDASGGWLAKPFLSFFPASDKMQEMWRPALLLNATHQETGRRLIASHLKIEKNVFLDAFDTLNLVESDMRASTAALNSARFLYVSPPGNLVSTGVKTGEQSKDKKDMGYVIDGGYYENYGALTALELAREVESNLRGKPVKIIVLQISSDPTMTRASRPRLDLSGEHCQVTTSEDNSKQDSGNFLDYGEAEKPGINFLNEILSPLTGVASAREARGRQAAEELATAICNNHGHAEQKASKAEASTLQAQVSDKVSDTIARTAFFFAHLAMCEAHDPTDPFPDRPTVVPPLGWVLSEQMREEFKQILDQCGNKNEFARLISELKGRESEASR